MSFYKTGMALAIAAMILGQAAQIEAAPTRSSTHSSLHSSMSGSGRTSSVSGRKRSENSGSSLHKSSLQPRKVNEAEEATAAKAKAAAEAANPAAMKQTDEERRAEQQAELKRQVDEQVLQKAREKEEKGRRLTKKEQETLDKARAIMGGEEKNAADKKQAFGAEREKSITSEHFGGAPDNAKTRVRSNDPDSEELSPAEQVWLQRRMEQYRSQDSAASDNFSADDGEQDKRDAATRDSAYWNSTAAQKRKLLPNDYRSITIFGDATVTKEQAMNLLAETNPDLPLDCSIKELVSSYWTEAGREGIRPDLALAQACVETGYFKFGGDVKASQNNFCGLGTVGGGARGAHFLTPQLGVRAHIQHLMAYASNDKPSTAIIDPRYDTAHKLNMQRGLSKTWSQLNGRWAMGSDYAEKIFAIFQLMEKQPSRLGRSDIVNRRGDARRSSATKDEASSAGSRDKIRSERKRERERKQLQNDADTARKKARKAAEDAKNRQPHATRIYTK